MQRMGYRVFWWPPVIFEKPESELTLTLDLVIAHLMLRKQGLFFVGIGANDGVSNEPLYPFVKRYGWRGVMIEPVPETFTLLQANYASLPSVELYNVAIDEQDGSRTLYTIRQEEGTFSKAHQFASFQKETILAQTAYVPNVKDLIEERTVSCMRLDTLLKRLGNPTVDILQIDAEGYDATILRMIDFQKMRPGIIHYEHANLSKADRDACARLLISEGYRFTNDTLDSTAYLMDGSEA